MRPGTVISIDSECFEALVDRLIEHIVKTQATMSGEKWVSSEECKRLLSVSSNTTLQQLRNSGAIRFSQPTRKVILYDRNSIEQYLEKHARQTF